MTYLQKICCKNLTYILYSIDRKILIDATDEVELSQREGGREREKKNLKWFLKVQPSCLGRAEQPSVSVSQRNTAKKIYMYKIFRIFRIKLKSYNLVPS